MNSATQIDKVRRDLEQSIELQKNVLRSLNSDVKRPNTILRWIEERKQSIAKIQREIDEFERRLDQGPELIEKAEHRLSVLQAKLSSLDNVPKIDKVKMLAKKLQALGVSSSEIAEFGKE